MDPYREEILEHWRNPQNFGEIKGADVVIDQVNPLCGDEVRFFFKFSPTLSSPRKRGSRDWIPHQVRDDKDSSRQARTIKDVRFTGSGCAISMASASMLSEAIKGKSIKQIEKITGQDILSLIGGNVAPARLKCAFLPLEVIRKLKYE
ncbi:MAG TPA: iron-sulfur cluster assembly scaffold protein [Candidatus Saccharimonadales bacterium]|nr:iron-sulfur cluster assembly scaffold protein [Candidatus Saccharimonadales bacterium]